MTRPGTGSPQWLVVDEGWGRKAADFATLSEPGNWREYVTVHHRLGVDAGDRLLDVACGSGLAVELARIRGASCSGIDASARLVAVARDRNPDSDIRVGDMNALPWAPASSRRSSSCAMACRSGPSSTSSATSPASRLAGPAPGKVLTRLARSARRFLRSPPSDCRWVTAASPRAIPATLPAARRAAGR